MTGILEQASYSAQVSRHQGKASHVFCKHAGLPAKPGEVLYTRQQERVAQSKNWAAPVNKRNGSQLQDAAPSLDNEPALNKSSSAILPPFVGVKIPFLLLYK